ncbi:MAG: hypothetical protein LC731_05635, partial [Acidobacteria bacterium]|nr:hypothetical protein [Acidobacteriota bacterium]
MQATESKIIDGNTAREELFSFQAPFLEEKLLDSGVFQTPEELHEAFTELKKYFLLNELNGSPFSMISLRVDTVWHEFILFTEEYHKFCERFFGKYIHHSPATSTKGTIPDKEIVEVAKLEFMRAYQKEFGALHP